ncbi:hypothetical protein [Acholeplasma granularum]|uniref:hypothetical protein n=1 Tax=Acholeplasma granularum TaxID=264635 RepID=UPI0004B79038|nr:hypothetical protein [Acholeplasma granularum]
MTTNIKSLITFLVVIVLSALLSITSYMVFNPIKEEKIKQETLTILDEYFSGVTDFEKNETETLSDVEILLSVRALKNEEPMGYLYEANYHNSFGNIKVRLVVDLKEIIQKAEFIELNQTMYLTQTTNNLQTYVQRKLNKDIFDGAAGVTSISINDLSHMISMIGLHHDSTNKFEVQLPYQEFFGEDYTITDTENLNEDGAKIVKETIGTSGYVYTLTKAGIYNSDSITQKEITVVVALNPNGLIIGTQLPIDLYGHSKGGYYNDALAFLQTYNDKDLTTLLDGQAGTTTEIAHNSRMLIEDIMQILKGVHTS